MANRPTNVTNLHAIAFLYIAMGVDDGELKKSESDLIVKCLFEYDSSNSNTDYFKEVIEETSNWIFSCADIDEKALIFKEMVDSLSTLSANIKLSIIKDLEKIAHSDGIIHENEQSFYSYVLTAFNS
jgi:hypothetical protein